MLRVAAGAHALRRDGVYAAVAAGLAMPAAHGCHQGDDSNPTSVRCELSSETNLFFYYYHELDEAGFRHLQEGQKLMVDFSEYAAVLLRMLNHCIKVGATCLTN